jgi:hypothetical protein
VASTSSGKKNTYKHRHRHTYIYAHTHTQSHTNISLRQAHIHAPDARAPHLSLACTRFAFQGTTTSGEAIRRPDGAAQVDAPTALKTLQALASLESGPSMSAASDAPSRLQGPPPSIGLSPDHAAPQTRQQPGSSSRTGAKAGAGDRSLRVVCDEAWLQVGVCVMRHGCRWAWLQVCDEAWLQVGVQFVMHGCTHGH